MTPEEYDKLIGRLVLTGWLFAIACALAGAGFFVAGLVEVLNEQQAVHDAN